MPIWIVAAAVAAIVASQENPSAAELRQGLAGTWEGALGYRDYQTNRLFELPVRTEMRMVGDGVTTLAVSRFDDGPTGIVYISSADLDDPAAGTVATTTLRKGRPVETSVETVSVDRYVDATHWTLIYSWRGEDDDKPADLRVTQTRDGDALLSVKEVRPEGGREWAFRNQTRLVRIE